MKRCIYITRNYKKGKRISRIKIEIDENTLKALVVVYLTEQLGDVTLAPEDIHIETKSKQNYKHEWEIAAFRATVDKAI